MSIAPRPLTRDEMIREQRLRREAAQPWIDMKASILSSYMPTYLIDRAGNTFAVEDGLTPQARTLIAKIDEVIEYILNNGGLYAHSCCSGRAVDSGDRVESSRLL